MRSVSAILVLLVCASVSAPDACAEEVTIYRCTDARGHLTLRDTPCASGEKQQTRNMLRPKDAPPAAVIAPRAVPEPYEPPAPRVVVYSAPRPLYECITPDGARYTSDSNQGNPRWVPLWTLGYPYSALGPGTLGPGTPGPGMSHNTQLAITHGSVRLHANRTTLSPAYPQLAYGAGTWVRDDCHELPPQEVCARLRDRRDEIRHRFFNAMPSERDVLRVEERGVNARLDNDCGGH
jgi:hypothetical protein